MNMRCALIDLSALSVEILTLSAIGWDIHLKMLKDEWNQNPDMISLSTGALTGTGAPGGGAFCWCCWKRNMFQVIPTEGRFGAVCRYGRIDHLLIKGMAERPLDIIVRDGEFTFLPATASQSGAVELYRHIRRQLDGDAVVMTVGAKEILEDGTFRIGDSSLARKLRSKNLRSIAAIASGGIPIHDPETFLAVCQEIYQARREKRSNPAQKAIARYLSLSDAADDGRAFSSLAMNNGEVQPAIESMLGLRWGNAFPLDNPLLYATRLMNAYTDEPFTTRSIKKSALESINTARIIRCGKEEGGSYGK